MVYFVIWINYRQHLLTRLNQGGGVVGTKLGGKDLERIPIILPTTLRNRLMRRGYLVRSIRV